ncbi:MAG: peroxiredoxin [Pseudomonadota bacterium]|nr:MAG: peroxiredoxin [Pseudomonadota bacterium]
MSLQTGDIAPDFTLTDHRGQPFTLSAAESRILLAFYPGDDTPVCTRQLCDYRDGIEQFRDLGVQVVGISPDDAERHRRFREKHRLPFVLLSDPDLAVADLYGCRGLIGMKRGVFLIDPGRIIRYGHVEAVAVFRRSRQQLISVIEQLD